MLGWIDDHNNNHMYDHILSSKYIYWCQYMRIYHLIVCESAGHSIRPSPIHAYIHIHSDVYIYILLLPSHSYPPWLIYAYINIHRCTWSYVSEQMMIMMMFILKKNYNEGVIKFNPTQKCRPAKGINKSVNIQK
jgi:hypothetical protein